MQDSVFWWCAFGIGVLLMAFLVAFRYLFGKGVDYIPSMIAFSVRLGRIAAAHLASSGK